ncbi:hypothetical protein MLD38_037416 [Melastoma candidum]|uniref:Uncharacterized protein n=1 Tax=Melastoma candidum TaxID=119954 RepID=A0ACB9LNV0_9MYRT|nr:hypothetical protein MLD38_037416 [Melastoma candidum]
MRSSSASSIIGKSKNNHRLMISLLLLSTLLLEPSPTLANSKSRTPISVRTPTPRSIPSSCRSFSISGRRDPAAEERCYADVESGLWGWQCKSSAIAKENCALKCLSPACYELVYESDPLEEGEKDFIRGQVTQRAQFGLPDKHTVERDHELKSEFKGN